MLHQHIQRVSNGRAVFDASGKRGFSRSGNFDQFKGVGGHARHLGGCTRLVAAAPGPLEQPRYPLWTADLYHALHSREVYAQIER